MMVSQSFVVETVWVLCHRIWLRETVSKIKCTVFDLFPILCDWIEIIFFLILESLNNLFIIYKFSRSEWSLTHRNALNGLLKG